jgi:hypothetical protein
MNQRNISLYTEVKKVTIKEIVFGTLFICVFLTVLLIVLLVPSWSSDLDVRVLFGDIAFFAFAALCSAVFVVVTIVSIIKFINKTTESTPENLIVFIVMFLIVIMFSFGSYKRAEDAWKDYNANDLYITGIVENTMPENDGNRPTVKFIDSPHKYDLFQLDVKLEIGSCYKFRYYQNSNLLYLVEKVIG